MLSSISQSHNHIQSYDHLYSKLLSHRTLRIRGRICAQATGYRHKADSPHRVWSITPVKLARWHLRICCRRFHRSVCGSTRPEQIVCGTARVFTWRSLEFIAAAQAWRFFVEDLESKSRVRVNILRHVNTSNSTGKTLSLFKYFLAFKQIN
jgi:hypothetical protein